MAGLTVTGTIKRIGKTKEFPTSSGDAFIKRAILLKETNGEHTNDFYAEFIQDKCSILDNYKVGDNVTLDVNVRCNEHNGKWFTNLNAWRIKNAGAESTAREPEQVADDVDDLPF